MGYQITLEETPPSRQPRTQRDACERSKKNASGEIFSRLETHAYQIAPQSLNLPRKKSAAPTTTASGRTFWLNRDPIQERGGFNIYGFVENNGVNNIDALGLVIFEFIWRWFRDRKKKPENTDPCNADTVGTFRNIRAEFEFTTAALNKRVQSTDPIVHALSFTDKNMKDYLEGKLDDSATGLVKDLKVFVKGAVGLFGKIKNAQGGFNEAQSGFRVLSIYVELHADKCICEGSDTYKWVNGKGGAFKDYDPVYPSYMTEKGLERILDDTVKTLLKSADSWGQSN